ncbi:hypothetical protein BGC33_01440, partial [Bathymodiolus thermophilus thioautotrophic gill symbiont]
IYKQKLQTYILANGKAERFLHFGSKNTDEIIIDLKLDVANGYYVGLIKDNDSNSLLIEHDSNSLLIEHDKGCFDGWNRNDKKTITRNSLESDIANDQKEPIVEYSKKYLRQCKLYHFHDTSDTAKFKS